MSLIKSVYESVFGNTHSQFLKKTEPTVEKINSLETNFGALSDEELKQKTQEFRDRLGKGETLDDILPEAFAVVREAAKRTLGMRHFDVQLVGGMALHHGNIAEMRTGEGKTLVATLPVYLNALEGKGVHVVTVNDYLARRDAVWMGQIYAFLGMSIGVIQNQRVSYLYDETSRAQTEQPKEQENEEEKEKDETGSYKVEYDYLRSASRQEAYRCDITYGTNNEFGFDYLRDNMVQNISEMVMRPGNEMHYAVVDEIDSILIDEARTPLIISAPAEEAADQYYHFAQLVKQLNAETDYNVDEKLRSSTLTEEGISKFEKWLGIENIYAEGGIRIVHHIEQALKAEVLFKRDKEYVVDNGEVIIIDEFTGRKMPGRRYSEGLHQAIEAKEGVSIQRESQTLATITFQNLFRMYKKLSGMTGTAATEEEEFHSIYGLDVIVVPTNKTSKRIDRDDQIYKTETGKYKAIVKRIRECQEKGQPILVGTISVEKNEALSAFLFQNGIQHEILNAKNHEREGEIIAQAGRLGAVTLATNMAGRGVDIKLGGANATPEERQKVADAGGLFVLGTERHESRRIDNQLRGRSARQGDPGETQFFVSTGDDLMRIFAGDRLKSIMEKLRVPEDMPIEQPMITRILENAQKKVEAHHFDVRKHLLSYDDILNRQRHVIYKKRRQILEMAAKDEGEQDVASLENVEYSSLREMLLRYVEEEIEFVVSHHTNADGQSVDGTWNLQEVYEATRTIFPLTDADKEKILSFGESHAEKLGEIERRNQLVEYLLEKAKENYVSLEQRIFSAAPADMDGTKLMRSIEKSLLLRAIDTLWVEHLVAMDYLRTSIGLRGYGQRDPLIEYKKESFGMFNELQANIQKEVVYSFYKVSFGIELAPSIMASDKMVLQGAQEANDETSSTSQSNSSSDAPRQKESKKERRKRQRMEKGLHS